MQTAHNAKGELVDYAETVAQMDPKLAAEVFDGAPDCPTWRLQLYAANHFIVLREHFRPYYSR